MKNTVKVLLLVSVIVFWVALDQWAKSLFTDAAPGTLYKSLFGGLVEIKLVRNTGAAWGIFADNPTVLGIFSLVVVAVLLVYFIWNIKSVTILQVVAAALIAAGGIGNVIDRFAKGFVTDFIAVTFIDFPVFNIADIGVTCGVILLFVSAFWVKDTQIRQNNR